MRDPPPSNCEMCNGLEGVERNPFCFFSNFEDEHIWTSSCCLFLDISCCSHLSQLEFQLEDSITKVPIFTVLDTWSILGALHNYSGYHGKPSVWSTYKYSEEQRHRNVKPHILSHTAHETQMVWLQRLSLLLFKPDFCLNDLKTP